MKLKSVVGCILLLCLAALPASSKRNKPPVPSTAPLDQFVRDAEARSAKAGSASPGSIWLSTSHITDLAADVRASQVDDLVTIVVSEQASAVATGTTQTQRASSTQNSVGALAGFVGTAGRLANLANVSGNTQLNGQGTTSRTTTVATTLTARVVHVLPNGALVVEGAKEMQVNSEHQTITVRGVVRPSDIDLTNSVASNRVAEMEIRINGKGVVGDAIRRPFILYRLLLGLLPF